MQPIKREVRNRSGTPSNEYILSKPAIVGNVLIVDDNEMNRDVLSRRLARQGHTVRTAVNGREAVEMISNQNFDLVLLDIMMPELNGYQVLQQIKEDPNLPYIPVIMITAVDQIDSFVRCLELGAEDYLTKPFDPVLLRARIGASLDKKRLTDQQAAYTHQLDLENRRKSDELEQLRNIQLSMLPATPPALEFLEIAAHQQTASEVGGDYYDFFPQPDGSLIIAMGDATGHGVGSGVMVAMTKASLLAATETDVSTLVEKTNNILSNIDLGLHLNMALMLFDVTPLEEGGVDIRVAGGGMPPLYILRANGTVEDMPIAGFPLGMFAGKQYHPSRFQLNSGDTLLLISDGLLEIFNQYEEFLGVDRFVSALNEIDHINRTADQILKAALNIGNSWAQGHI